MAVVTEQISELVLYRVVEFTETSLIANPWYGIGLGQYQRKQSATLWSVVACCVTGQFILPNPSGTDKDDMNHYCHLPYMRNQRDRANRK